MIFDDYSGEIVNVDSRGPKPVEVQRASASRGGGRGTRLRVVAVPVEGVTLPAGGQARAPLIVPHNIELKGKA
jgi:hypothetical protein